MRDEARSKYSRPWLRYYLTYFGVAFSLCGSGLVFFFAVYSKAPEFYPSFVPDMVASILLAPLAAFASLISLAATKRLVGVHFGLLRVLVATFLHYLFPLSIAAAAMWYRHGLDVLTSTMSNSGIYDFSILLFGVFCVAIPIWVILKILYRLMPDQGVEQVFS